MLRSSIIVAVIACILAAYAPTVFPALFQTINGAAGAPPPLAAAAPPPPVVQASASHDAGDRIAEIYADSGGQYSTEVIVNGAIVHMMVDTGATLVVLSADTAQRLGLPLSEASYTAVIGTANGRARAAPIVLSAVSVGDIYVPAVQGVVLDPQAGHVDLLGMSFLKRLSSVEQKAGRLVLRQ